LGQLPEIDLFTGKGEKRPPETGRKPLLWAPGQTLDIRLADYIDEIQDMLEQFPGVNSGRTHYSRTSRELRLTAYSFTLPTAYDGDPERF
jgi:hypothetical protein